MKYLKSFNENNNGLPTYDDDYLKDSKKKLALINGIVKLVLDNTKQYEVVFFSEEDILIDDGYGKKVKISSIDYNKRDRDFRVYYQGDEIEVSWLSILELSYTDLQKILLYLITYHPRISGYAQTITNDTLKKINQ